MVEFVYGSLADNPERVGRDSSWNSPVVMQRAVATHASLTRSIVLPFGPDRVCRPPRLRLPADVTRLPAHQKRRSASRGASLREMAGATAGLREHSERMATEQIITTASAVVPSEHGSSRPPWCDRAARTAAQDPSSPPPALALFDKVVASHSHDVLAFEEESEQ